MWDWKTADWNGYKEYLKRSVDWYNWNYLSLTDFEYTVRDCILYAVKSILG